jgi:hypothetical protein
MAFPHGERSKLISIGLTPSGGLSTWMEGLAKPSLLLGVLAASPMLGRLSIAAALAAPSTGTLPASWLRPLGVHGMMSVVSWVTHSYS